MPQTIRQQRPAMGTWFEARLVGDDPEHLAAVAEAVLDEVGRIDRLLSRFDPRSEVARINREASRRALLVDREVLGLLETCRTAWERTEGSFDVTASAAASAMGDLASNDRPTFAAVIIDLEARTVRFARPGVALDLGGIGKGYALDRAAEIVAAQGVRSAFLHGGTSSILALGLDEMGRPWPIGVRDPFAAPGATAELFRVSLEGRGFSCSATRAPGQACSDLIDPRRGTPLSGHSACVAIAGDATWAEVLSTALLCMGKGRAAGYAGRYAEGDGFDVAWIECRDDRPAWDWLTRPQ
jgi:thiamine biosynthesis lipoprotein